MPRGTKRYKVVRVEWEDITSIPDSWTDDKEIEKYRPDVCVTWGYLVRQTKDRLYIAQTKSVCHIEHHLEWANVDMIPRGCVKKIEVMRKET